MLRRGAREAAARALGRGRLIRYLCSRYGAAHHADDIVQDVALAIALRYPTPCQLRFEVSRFARYYRRRDNSALVGEQTHEPDPIATLSARRVAEVLSQEEVDCLLSGIAGATRAERMRVRIARRKAQAILS